MATASTLSNRIMTGLGLACLVMTLLLLSVGVRAVRADSEAEAMSCVEPSSEPSTVRETSPAKPITVPSGDTKDPALADVIARPGPANIEVEPGVIVLNTRGYNYGPPPDELDPAALRVESGTR